MAKVKITETVLRDGQQSLIATRMSTQDMIPILETMDQAGYHAIEMWGGATFDSCLRFLDEDPWERLRTIRKHVKNTKLQMLLRGQNLLGYKHYADDVVDEFVNKAVGNGIDIIRTFDALNDPRNLEASFKAIKKYGAHAQAAISYTVSPVHTDETFVKLAKEMVQMGADSICIKDMSGLLNPYGTFLLVKALKEAVRVPIEIHTHATSGLGAMTLLKAIEAGADIVDTAISPFAEGTSQPATEPLAFALKGTKWDPKLDMDKLNEIADHFRPLREKCIESGLLSTKVMGVDINTLKYQVPGGMLSNLVSQLKQQNALDKFEEVLKEVPRVREDMGFPPLVTPSSQIVGTQAVLNVVLGERYKMCTSELKQLVKGMYGRTAVPISEEIYKKVVGAGEPVTCRPADLIDPELENIKKDYAEWVQQDEDVLTAAMFPKQAVDFFKSRREKECGIDLNLVDQENMVYPV
ncbi:MAG: oxaloacetate decarboxylase subunit alpha [Clostridiales bacterium]|nr:oxaloacetate decarboxylase subunit alpha [Clostridiales bacterium]